MKLPCRMVGDIAEVVCQMFVGAVGGVSAVDGGQLVGALVRSWQDRLTGEYGMSADQATECVAEGERLGKALAEFFQHEGEG